MSYTATLAHACVVACLPRGKLKSYLDQLILHVVAEASVLIAIPEVLSVVLSGCDGCCMITAILRGRAVRKRRHDMKGKSVRGADGKLWEILKLRDDRKINND